LFWKVKTWTGTATSCIEMTELTDSQLIASVNKVPPEILNFVLESKNLTGTATPTNRHSLHALNILAMIMIPAHSKTIQDIALNGVSVKRQSTCFE
jgi:hypothetical protein